MNEKEPNQTKELRELSAKELDSVTGGFNPQPDPPAKTSRPQDSVSFDFAAVQVTYTR